MINANFNYQISKILDSTLKTKTFSHTHKNHSKVKENKMNKHLRTMVKT